MLARHALLVLGLLAMLAGAALSVVWLRLPQVTTVQRSTVRPVATVTVLVAARPLSRGTLLRPDDMKWRQVLEAEVGPADIVRGGANDKDFVGAVVRRPFRADDPLRVGDLVMPTDRDFLVAALAPGDRAVSINVNASTSDAGLILPGDYVDVILTQVFPAQATTDAGHRSVGETILRNVRVLATDQRVDTRAKLPSTGALAGGAHVPKTITLEVTEKQARMLLVAEQLGRVQLVLRGAEGASQPAPAEGAGTGPVWGADVSEAIGKPAGGGKEKSTEQWSIDVMRGSKTERQCITPAGLVPCR